MFHIDFCPSQSHTHLYLKVHKKPEVWDFLRVLSTVGKKWIDSYKHLFKEQNAFENSSELVVFAPNFLRSTKMYIIFLDCVVGVTGQISHTEYVWFELQHEFMIFKTLLNLTDLFLPANLAQ